MPSDTKPEPRVANLPPASQSNRARQTRSRQNITHPVTFKDQTLEETYNRTRKISQRDRKSAQAKSELRRLH